MMRKGIEFSTVIRFLIFLVIIGAVIFFIIRAIDSSNKDSEIIDANDYAGKVYNGAEDWLSTHREIVSNANVKLDTKLVFVSNENNNRNADATVNGKIVASMYMNEDSKDYIKGNWIVVIDKKTLSIEYAMWSEDKLTAKDAQKLTTLESQRQLYKEKKKIIGYSSKNT